MVVVGSACVPPGATKLLETSISLSLENALLLLLLLIRSRNIVWVSHLLLLPDLKKTSESSIPPYCSVLFTTVICGWEEFILIYFSFVIPRLALLCEPLVLVRYGNCSNLSLHLGPVTLFWVVWVIYCF